MSIRDHITFLQLFGGTTFDALGEPTARTSTLVNAADESAAWSMQGAHMITVELDSTNRGGGILAAAALIERATLPVSFRFAASAGVIWVPVPTAEIGFDAIAAQNVQIQEFSLMACACYRLAITGLVGPGDLWAGMSARII